MKPSALRKKKPLPLFPSGDPFDKFLSKMDASTPHTSSSSSSSTSQGTATHSSSTLEASNTLSDMPSIIEQDKDSTSLNLQELVDVTPVVVGTRHHRARTTGGRVVEQGGLRTPSTALLASSESKGNSCSPGEMKRSELKVFASSQRKHQGSELVGDVESSVTYEKSAGEVPRRMRFSSDKMQKRAAHKRTSFDPTFSRPGAYSPGELRQTRNGIDVINISQQSHHYSSPAKPKAKTITESATLAAAAAPKEEPPTAVVPITTDTGGDTSGGKVAAVSDHTITTATPQVIHVSSSAPLEGDGQSEAQLAPASPPPHSRAVVGFTAADLPHSFPPPASDGSLSSNVFTPTPSNPTFSLEKPVVLDMQTGLTASAKPTSLMFTIPTGDSHDFSHSTNSSNKGTYSSDFEFSSVSLPEF